MYISQLTCFCRISISVEMLLSVHNNSRKGKSLIKSVDEVAVMSQDLRRWSSTQFEIIT